MKTNFFKLIPLACMLAASASAGVYQIVSGDSGVFGSTVLSNQTNTGNNGGSAATASYNIQPNGGWANIKLDGTLLAPGVSCGTNGNDCAKWISSDNTQEPNPVIPNGTWVDFTHTFTLDAAALSSSFKIFADDLADVKINGTTVYTSINTGNATCNTSPIGCILANVGIAGTTANFQSLTPFLTAGVNNLVVRVYQTNGGGFGTTYLADITTVPEPGFYGLLSVGVGALLFRARRRSA